MLYEHIISQICQYRLFEQDPGDGLVEGRRGEAAQVGPVALAGRQEARGVDGLLQGEGVALPVPWSKK